MPNLLKYRDPSGEGVNLDSQSLEALTEIAAAIRHNAEWAAEDLFPNRGLPIEGRAAVVEVVKTLGRYAAHKAEAMRLRATGRERPGYAEAACESLYADLPEWAKWKHNQ